MTLTRACSPVVANEVRPRALPLGVCGMVALIVVSECLVAPRLRSINPVGRVEMSWNASAAAAGGALARADVLCLGDSLIKLGILPRVLEVELGKSVYNLGVLGGQAPSSYFLLRRVLKQGICPQALLVDFSEDLMSLAPGLNPTCWADSLGCRQGLQLAWHSRDPELAISTGLHCLLPRWCDQNQQQPFSGVGALSRTVDDPRVFDRNWRFNRGAQVAPRAFVPVEVLTSANGKRWQPHPANAFYVDCLLRAADARQVPVFWILTPSIRGRHERLEQYGVNTAFRKFIAERLGTYACLTVLDGGRLFEDTDAFRDPIHVNRDGAIRLSVAVATAIRPRLNAESSAPRWIDLVSTTNQDMREYQELVEDLDQSRAAALPTLVGQTSREVAAW
jgi:hypothetical protein